MYKVTNIIWVCLCSAPNVDVVERCVSCGTSAKDCKAPYFDLTNLKDAEKYNQLMSKRLKQRNAEPPMGPPPPPRRGVRVRDEGPLGRFCQCEVCRPDLHRGYGGGSRSRDVGSGGGGPMSGLRMIVVIERDRG